jgi:hypothetical protein
MTATATISLGAGVHAPFTLSNLTEPTIIRGTPDTVLQGLRLKGTTVPVTIQNLVFAAPDPNGNCLDLPGARKVLVEDCEFRGGLNGIAMQQAKWVQILRSEFHGHGGDCIHGIFEHVLVQNCYMHDLYDTTGIHPDVFQLWTDPAPASWFDNGIGPQDVKFLNNLYLRGGGNPAQGPFFHVSLPISDVLIAGNYLLGVMGNGISASMGGFTATDNVVGTWDYEWLVKNAGSSGKPLKPPSVIRNNPEGGTTASGNRAQKYSGFLDAHGKLMNPPPNNALLGDITDEGAALAAEFRKANPLVPNRTG